MDTGLQDSKGRLLSLASTWNTWGAGLHAFRDVCCVPEGPTLLGLPATARKERFHLVKPPTFGNKLGSPKGPFASKIWSSIAMNDGLICEAELKYGLCGGRGEEEDFKAITFIQDERAELRLSLSPKMGTECWMGKQKMHHLLSIPAGTA